MRRICHFQAKDVKYFKLHLFHMAKLIRYHDNECTLHPKILATSMSALVAYSVFITHSRIHEGRFVTNKQS